MPPDVCRIDWDGRYLTATIDLFAYIFRPEVWSHPDTRILALDRSIEIVRRNERRVWFRPQVPRRDLMIRAKDLALKEWKAWESRTQISLLVAPPCRLYYDRSAELFDHGIEIADTLRKLCEHADMNRFLDRHKP